MPYEEIARQGDAEQLSGVTEFSNATKYVLVYQLYAKKKKNIYICHQEIFGSAPI